MDGVTRIETLMGVEVFKVSERFIYHMRENEYKKDKIFDFLPTYTISENKGSEGRIVIAEHYLQFAGFHEPENDDKSFIFFNLNPCDTFLDEELNEVGIEYMLEGYDFRKILEPFIPDAPIKTNKDHNFFRTVSNYFIVEITYTTSQDYYSGGYETEVDYEIIGYLNGKLERKEYGEIRN